MTALGDGPQDNFNGLCLLPIGIIGLTAVTFATDAVLLPFRYAGKAIKVMRTNRKNRTISRQLGKLFYGEQNRTSVVSHKSFKGLEQFLQGQFKSQAR
jgi:hypothetical protein